MLPKVTLIDILLLIDVSLESSTECVKLVDKEGFMIVVPVCSDFLKPFYSHKVTGISASNKDVIRVDIDWYAEVDNNG